VVSDSVLLERGDIYTRTFPSVLEVDATGASVSRLPHSLTGVEWSFQLLSRYRTWLMGCLPSPPIAGVTTDTGTVRVVLLLVPHGPKGFFAGCCSQSVVSLCYTGPSIIRSTFCRKHGSRPSAAETVCSSRCRYRGYEWKNAEAVAG
jgi:hypothetical protein